MSDLRLEQVTFAYSGGVGVFNPPGLTLELSSGPIALVGENGAGKTTLTKLLNGLLRPAAGTITVAGYDVRQRSVAQMAEVVGYAFQNPDDQLFQRTVYDEVAFGPKAMRRSNDRVARAVDKALEQCGLMNDARTHPHDLGLPDRKWVTIASAHASEAPVLVFDEPTLGQDWAAKQRLKSLIRLLANSDRLVLVVTHDMDFVAEACVTTVVLSHGTIRYQGPTGSAFTDTGLINSAGLELPATARLGIALGLQPPPVGEKSFVEAFKARS